MSSKGSKRQFKKKRNRAGHYVPTFLVLFVQHSRSDAIGEEVARLRGHVAADGGLLQPTDVPDVLRAVDQETTIRGRRGEPPQRLEGGQRRTSYTCRRRGSFPLSSRLKYVCQIP